MALIRVTAVALLLVNTAWTSHPSELARDQYKAREDGPQLSQLLREATDHSSQVHASHQFNDTKIDESALLKQNIDCTDKLLAELSKHTLQRMPLKESWRRRRRDTNPTKRKRSYYPWPRHVIEDVPYQSITAWRPPFTQLSRPYVIPIYGVSGRIPIYYPPQPLLINPGMPVDNPFKRPTLFPGPAYLPPPLTTTTPKPDPAMSFPNRFLFEDDLIAAAQKPGNEAVPPTRRPTPQRIPQTHPPLVHNDMTNSAAAAASEEQSNSQSRPTITTTAPDPAGPSRCVWAIVSCCAGTSTTVSNRCFEQRGCPGPFWDRSPCESNFAKAAIESALNYYSRK